MILRFLAGCLLALSLVALMQSFDTPRAYSADGTPQRVSGLTVAQRQANRQKPLLQRPNRPGHIYGNTMRRIFNRRGRRG